MQTVISEINEKSLRESKRIILEGGLVAFPTETVYGLGANAFCDDAVKNVFIVKGRPQDNPLIAHVHPKYDISRLIDYDPPYAKVLRETFLPGPLTLVYKSSGKVSRYVSCGLDTLAIRVPCHKGAQEFLQYVDLPVVAPSANISKHISPVTSRHVFDDLSGKIPLILEGGRCKGGIESTVCDVTGDIPMILREGLVTQEMIKDAVGACELYHMKEGEKPKSPGMAYKHYSPSCPTKLLPSGSVEELKALYAEAEKNGLKPYILAEGKAADLLTGYRVLSLGYTPNEMAANLYELLHVGEREADIIIAMEPEKKDGVMAGVLNRLTRACRS